jgi:hypothetical protein
MQGNNDLLASRVREIRAEKFGAEGVAEVSQAMNIPVRTWEHFEMGGRPPRSTRPNCPLPPPIAPDGATGDSPNGPYERDVS